MYRQNDNIAEEFTRRLIRKSERKVRRFNEKVQIVPLGGLNEIGKNMTCFICGQDMFILDCGLSFPEPDMLGVDIVIPDFTFVEQNISKLRGMVITHGHEDHIGAVPFFLKKVSTPVYGTKLTMGLIEEKLGENKVPGIVKLNVCKPGQVINFGCISVEFINVNHSIPDATGVAIHTPAGVLIHTGDFKVDYNPIDGSPIDLARFAELGSKGVLMLMSDSTNAERPGYTMPERQVGESFDKLFNEAGGRRIIVATFSSNVHRIQQIIDNAKNYDRKVAVAGRSMENVVKKAIQLGYLNVPDGIMVPVDTVSQYSSEQIIVVTTGSQGEPMSALSRMASGDHRQITITDNDFIIISASPIPGNEKHVTNVINDLMRLGAKVIYEKMYEVHTSGHACRDELKMMLSLTKPKYFMPVHGEYKHLKSHAELAISMGISPQNVIIGDIGQVVSISDSGIEPGGTVDAGPILIDGFGVGDVGSVVLRDRQVLAEDGLIIVVAVVSRTDGRLLVGPNLVSRGFVYVKESEELFNEAKEVVYKVFKKYENKPIKEWNIYKVSIRDELSGFIRKKTRKNPMILPIVLSAQ